MSQEPVLAVTGISQEVPRPFASSSPTASVVGDFDVQLEVILAETQPVTAGVEMDYRWPWSRASYASHGLNCTARVNSQCSPSLSQQMRLYMEDQLLAHPGGDGMDLEAQDPRIENPPPDSFLERIGKDLRDALANAANFLKDLFLGSSYRYVEESGRVGTAHRGGLLGNVLEFFKDLASGLSLGFFRPDGEPEPKGIVDRLTFAGKKIFGEAIMDDLVYGVPSSAVNLLDDAALAAWNLLEVVPDATIGSLPGGREIVTTIFDNGQVIIDYVTDCLPAGEAWMRVHGYRLDAEGAVPPILYNLQLPERYSGDARWATVRNTPFRKTIETVGSLLADFALARLTTHGPKTSKRRQ